MKHLGNELQDEKLEVQKAIELYSNKKWDLAYKTAIPFAEKGNTKAQRMIGNLYAQGKIGAPNFRTAQLWWKIAAESGDVQSQFNYGLSCQNGDGADRNPVEAEVWLLEAAQGGHSDAMRALGDIYINGFEGIPPNPPLGYMWLRIASVFREMAGLTTLGQAVQKLGLSNDSTKLAVLNKKSLQLTVPYANAIGIQLSGEIDRDEILSYFISKQLYTISGMQGQSTNLGTENPNRKSEGTLRDMGVETARMLDGVRHFIHPSTHTWVFYRRGFRLNGPEAIPVDKSILWQLVRPGDWIEISDNINSHVTLVFSIDRKNEVIKFIDPWPDDFMLLPGRNVAGVSAKTEEFGKTRIVISITKQEFLYTVRGIHTVDDAQCINKILNFYPELKKRTQVNLAVGSILIRHTDPNFAALGTGYLWAVVKTPKEELHPSSISFSTDRLSIGVEQCKKANIESISYFDFSSEQIKNIPLSKIVKLLKGSLKPNFMSLDPELLANLALNKALSGDPTEAQVLVSNALKIVPNNEILLFTQARVYIVANDSKSAVSSLNKAVKVLKKKMAKNDILVRTPNNVLTGYSTGKKKIKELLNIVLTIRAKVLLKLKRPKNAINDLKEVLETYSNNVEAIKLLIQAYELNGDFEEKSKLEERLKTLEIKNLYSNILGVSNMDGV